MSLTPESDHDGELSTTQRALLALRKARARLDALERSRSEPIAIVGAGCRFPGGGDDPDAYFAALERGVDGVRRIPAERWPAGAGGDGNAVRWAALLEQVDGFDHAFFGISPREAASLDPQQRLLLEVAWEALEHAGQPVDALAGSRTGVFVGICSSDYKQLVAAGEPFDAYAGTGNAFSTTVGRVAYSFGFQGPAVAVDTACSSSLVAVHLACQSLRSGESDVALAGGVNLIVAAAPMRVLAATQALSPDGRCKTFDAGANGYVRGEGCGVVVLKRLSDAERDGDRILAVVRGSAVNQDGRSTGLTTPNVLAQEAMLRQALEAARLSPDDVDYIETHGTGTSLGDPIELDALSAVFGGARPDSAPCVLGAVKTNIGHLEAAAGIAGLIKVVGCLGAGRIPRNLHLTTVNPRIRLDGTRFVLPRQTMPWAASARPRRAGISSFGIGGTNAHVLVEEAPPVKTARPETPPAPSLLLPLSARDEAALVATARAHAERLAATAPDELADVVYSASVRRAHHAHRLAVVGTTGGELAAALDGWARGEAPAAVVAAVAAERKPRSLFVFSGQGSQWAGMGRRLRESEPVFRDVLNECDALVQQHAGWSLLERLDDAEQLSRTEVAQPAIVAVELALVALLAEWGVKPDAVIGHSVGEIAAAKVAGVLTLGEAMRLACVRGRIMQAATGKGRMVAATLAAVEAAKYVEGELAIAAVNDPGQVVFAGPSAQIETLTGRLTAAGVRTRPLRVDYAFHSPQMAPLAAQLEAELSWLEPAAATLPLYSTVSGARISEALDRNYWARNVLQTVRMAEATAAAAADGQRLFVEVGPHATLTQNLEASLAERGDARVLPTLRRDRDDRRALELTLASLYTLGQPLSWARAGGRRLVTLPRYPWQRRRHWVDATADAAPLAGTATGHPLLGVRLPIAGGGGVYESVLDLRRSPWLAEHRLFGRAVAPGALLVELAYAAAADCAPAQPIELRQLVLQSPLSLEAGARRIQVVVTDGDASVAVYSRDAAAAPEAPWTLHARGQIERGAAVAADPATRDHGGAAVDVDALYRRFAVEGLDYGAAFRGLRRLARHGRFVSGRVELPDSLGDGAAAHALHPALLDAALQALAAAAGDGDGRTRIPFELGTFALAQPGARAAWLDGELTEQGDSVAGELYLRDDAGAAIATLRGLRFAVAAPAASAGDAGAPDWLYRVDWIDAPLPPSPPPAGRWLVVGTGALAEATSARLRAAGSQVEHDVAAALADAQLAGALLFADGDGAELPVAATAATEAALALAQALIARPSPLRLAWVTVRAQAVVAGEPLAPANAALWGVGRALALEHPQLRCRLVDVAASDEAAVAAVWAELAAAGDERESAWRDGRRRVPRLARVRATAPAVLAADATVLVTGGLGGLGLQVAAWLWQTQRVRHLVLVGRSAPTGERLAAVERLRADGATVTLAQLDVADAAALQRLIDGLPADPPLRGVIHAAGALDDRLIGAQDAASIATALAPKVAGAWNLHRATAARPLDFFVIFSSAASLLGAAGQANYAAANAVCDALAHQRRAAGLPAQTLHWGPWADAGMLARLDDSQRARLTRQGFDLIAPADGLAALGAALAAAEPELAILPVDLRRLRDGHDGVVPPIWRGLVRGAAPAASPVVAGDAASLLALVRREVGRQLDLDAAQVPEDRPLRELGFDSLMAVALRNALAARLGLSLPATLAFDYPTARALATHLVASLAPPTTAATPTTALALGRAAEEPIAIIGAGCRYPGGVRTPDELWRLVADGVDAIADIPADRWDVDALYDPDPDAPGKMCTRSGGFLDGIDRFDPDFFGISPREAAAMDPQQRLLLETAWEALERAGLVPERLIGSDTGVFVGLMYHEYWTLQPGYDHLDGYVGTGSSGSVASGRLSYQFGFKGPSMTVDTACSSSLVALHLACQSLRAGETSLALAGGAAIMFTPASHIEFTRVRGLAPDGRCKSFDASADGVGWSEGCGVLVLKRLADARRDGDPILGLVRGSAVNQDGRSNGLTAPNGPSQEEVIGRALAQAELAPAAIDFVEAHGTGTPLGDPIELQALGNALGRGRAAARPLMVGSIKSNLGHTQAAAGVAGVIKTLEALRREQIPRSLHFTTPNPRVDWAALPLQIAARATAWPRGAEPRRAGVSSFGVSGTNAHVILEEAPATPPAAAAAPATPPAAEAAPAPRLVPLSARTPAALRALAAAWADALVADAPALADVAYTAAQRRTHHGQRLAVAAASTGELATALAALGRGERPAGVALGEAAAAPPKVAFIFPGQGSQWPGMCRALYAAGGAFADAFAACDAAIAAEAGFSVVAALQEPEAAFTRIDRLQPLLFAIEVALAAEWRRAGITPDAVVGHSMGEAAAAVVAGALTLADGARVICRRSHLLLRVAGQGAMALVELPLADAEQAIAAEPTLSVAVSNGPRSTVIAGDPAAVDRVLATLAERAVFCRRVKVDVASHSPQMDPLREPLLAELAELSPRSATVAMRSTVSGLPVDGRELDAGYWADNLRRPVRFGAAIQALIDDGFGVFIELSPHPILVPAVVENLAQRGRDGLALPTLRRDVDEPRALAEAQAELYVRGLPLAWPQLAPTAQVLPLPTYRWQRERHWLDGTGAAAPRRAAGAHPFLGAPFTTSSSPGTRFFPLDLDVTRLRYLADHRVDGVLLVPGALYVEALLAAGRQLGPGRDAVIEELELVRPLALPDDAPLTAELACVPDGADGWRMQIASRDGDDWVVHAGARLRLEAAAAVADEAPPATVRARCQQAFDGPTYRQLQAERGLQLGPAFQGVEAAWRGDGEALGALRLPADGAAYCVHPLLLDGALQLAGLALDDAALADRAPRVLARVGRLRLHAPPRGVLFSHAYGDRVRVTDEQGRVVVAIDGVDLRRLARRRDGAAPWLATRYLPAPPRPPVAADAARGRWLLLADEGGVAPALAATLRAHGGSPILLRAGDVDLTAAAPFDALLARLFADDAPLRAIVDLWPVDPVADDSTAALAAAQARGLGAALALVQALARSERRQPPRLQLVTRGSQPLADDTAALAVAQAPLWGLGRTLALEHPELRPARIDLDPRPAPDEAEALLAELLADDGEDEVALRRAGRYLARLGRVAEPLPELAPPPPIRADASYLVVGGLGGLGLLAARWLVEDGARHLILVGRRGLSDDAQAAAVAELRARGATVTVAAVDVADGAALASLLAAVDDGPFPLAGVFHVAGVLADGLVLSQDLARAQQVLAPKMLGAWNLHLATRDRPLDFFVLYSSAAALFGTAGLGNYVAANSFLDALAEARRRAGLPALSLGWGPFADVGMGKTAATSGNLDRGARPFSADEGAALFRRLLRVDAAQLGVIDFDARQWLELHPLAAQSGRYAPLVAEARRTTAPAPAGGAFVAALAAASPAERETLVAERVRADAAAVLRLDPAALDPQAPLRERGMDSIMALELRNRLEAALGLRLSATLVFSFGSVAALATHLASQLAAIPAAVPPPATALAHDVVPVSPAAPASDAAGMSDDELLAAFDASLERIDRSLLS